MGSSSIAREIANAHMFFNLINAMIFLPFTGSLARLVEKIIPIKKDVEGEFKPVYLTGEIGTISLALEQCYREILRAADILNDLLKTVNRIWRGEFESVKIDIQKNMIKSDILHNSIQDFLSKMAGRELTDKESKETSYYFNLIENFKNLAESVGQEFYSHIDKNENSIKMLTEDQIKELEFFETRANELFEKNKEALQNKRIEPAEEANLLYSKLKSLGSRYQDKNFESIILRKSARESIANFISILDEMRLIARRIKIISRTILEKSNY
jgi:phosphate:Na+ symporter